MTQVKQHIWKRKWPVITIINHKCFKDFRFFTERVKGKMELFRSGKMEVAPEPELPMSGDDTFVISDVKSSYHSSTLIFHTTSALLIHYQSLSWLRSLDVLIQYFDVLVEPSPKGSYINTIYLHLCMCTQMLTLVFIAFTSFL